jgi:hypothetical protein
VLRISFHLKKVLSAEDPMVQGDVMHARMTSMVWMMVLMLTMVVKPVFAAEDSKPTVTVGGMVDAYYTYNFTNAAANANGAGNNGSFFNNVDNSYTLGLAEVKANATQGQASAHVVFAYGQESSLILSGLGIDVLQAYVSYNPGEWTFNFGRFVTWMGNEVIESNANWNYGRSLLFWYTIPLWHTGLSVNYAASDSKFSMTGYVTNGWNNTFAGSNSMEKTYGLQFILKPSADLSVALNGARGPNPLNVTDGSSHFVGEGIVTFTASDKLTLAADWELGIHEMGAVSGTFWGLAVYGRYQIESDWATALRLEEVKDNNNVLGLYGAIPIGSATDVEAREMTLTVEHNFTPNLIARLEGRYDMALSGGAQYSKTTAPPGPFQGGSGDQLTGTGSLVFGF